MTRATLWLLVVFICGTLAMCGYEFYAILSDHTSQPCTVTGLTTTTDWSLVVSDEPPC